MTVVGRAAAAARAARAVPAADRADFADAWWTLLGCAARLRLGGGPARRRLLADEQWEDARGTGPAPDERLLRLFGHAARHHVVGLPCLPRAVALGRFLARRGISSCLRLGVRRGTDGWEGHAWRERDGRVVGDAEAFVRGFRPLEPPGPTQRAVAKEEET